MPVPAVLAGAPGGCAPCLTISPVGPQPASSRRALLGICDSTSSMSPSRNWSGSDHASLLSASERGTSFPSSPSRSTLRSAPEAIASTASLIQISPPDCVKTAGDNTQATHSVPPLCASRNARRPSKKGAEPRPFPCPVTNFFTATSIDLGFDDPFLSRRSPSVCHWDWARSAWNRELWGWLRRGGGVSW